MNEWSGASAKAAFSFFIKMNESIRDLSFVQKVSNPSWNFIGRQWGCRKYDRYFDAVIGERDFDVSYARIKECGTWPYYGFHVRQNTYSLIIYGNLHCKVQVTPWKT